MTENTLRPHYTDRAINATYENNGSLFWETYETQKYILWENAKLIMLKLKQAASLQTVITPL
jgi:hypothetical protein